MSTVVKVGFVVVDVVDVDVAVVVVEGEGVKGEEYRLGVKGRCLLRFPPCYQVLAADKHRMCHSVATPPMTYLTPQPHNVEMVKLIR